MIGYLEKSAQFNYPPAMIKYALFLEKGIYVPRDYKKAYQYFLLAAKMGSEKALYHLGRWHFYGVGQEEDKQLALDYFKQASLKNDPEASFMIGYMYHYGDGIPQDLHQAQKYYLKALDEGNEDAQKELDKLEVIK